MSEPPSPPQVTSALGGSGLDPGTATVAALRRALTEGALTAAELTAFYLSRIERLNPGLRAVISVSPQAAADARASDEARARGSAPGPLAGIPVLIKDNIAVAGMPATAGSPALAEADQDEAFLVTGLREAGAVILGKANLSEWAGFRSSHSTSGWSTLGGQAVNPHGRGRNPSGSSSGSGVAVAAGLAPLAVGTETDGSIVCPASACGIVGIKPTLGLVSRSGIVPISLAQDTAGPMTRSVADAAALLSVLAAPDPADPATAPAAVRARDYTGYLAAAVNRECNALVTSFQRAQVLDVTVPPKNSVYRRNSEERIDATIFGEADSQPTVTGPKGTAAVGAGKRTEVCQHTVTPLERMEDKGVLSTQ